MKTNVIAILFIILVLVLTPLAMAEEMGVFHPGSPPDVDQTQETNRLDPGASMMTHQAETVIVNGEPTEVYPMSNLHSGMMIPDGQGNYVWVGANNPVTYPGPSEAGARELKLKVRELADQLLTGFTRTELANIIAMPTSFVNQDNFEETSSFGRYIAEQMFHEFTQRGFPIREYRMQNQITSRYNDGDFALVRNVGAPNALTPAALVLVGTYYHDSREIFVNARLVQAATGLVLRTGMLTFSQTPVTRRMFAKARMEMETSFLGIRDFDRETGAVDQTAIDRGFDIR